MLAKRLDQLLLVHRGAALDADVLRVAVESLFDFEASTSQAVFPPRRASATPPAAVDFRSRFQSFPWWSPRFPPMPSLSLDARSGRFSALDSGFSGTGTSGHASGVAPSRPAPSWLARSIGRADEASLSGRRRGWGEAPESLIRAPSNSRSAIPRWLTPLFRGGIIADFRLLCPHAHHLVLPGSYPLTHGEVSDVRGNVPPRERVPRIIAAYPRGLAAHTVPQQPKHERGSSGPHRFASVWGRPWWWQCWPGSSAASACTAGRRWSEETVAAAQK
jgi:hypothetical protein